MSEYFVIKKQPCTNCRGTGKAKDESQCSTCKGDGYIHKLIELEKAINYLLNTNRYKPII
jgi:DnaJ-class molecular chaperone